MTDLQQSVLVALAEQGLTAREIGRRTATSTNSIRSVLLTLNGKGMVKRNLDGPPTVWRLP